MSSDTQAPTKLVDRVTGTFWILKTPDLVNNPTADCGHQPFLYVYAHGGTGFTACYPCAKNYAEAGQTPRPTRPLAA